MLFAHTDTVNEYHPRLWEYPSDLAALAFFVTSDNNNGVSFFNVKGVHMSDYTTSGAREIIV